MCDILLQLGNDETCKVWSLYLQLMQCNLQYIPEVPVGVLYNFLACHLTALLICCARFPDPCALGSCGDTKDCSVNLTAAPYFYQCTCKLGYEADKNGTCTGQYNTSFNIKLHTNLFYSARDI